ncbi:MAG: hypothetical protein BMS9Abin34_489 [Patescibacteria group bacterium]|nr:MAG: hypothetical protein BMS9Abin34_489 [Patescibacteria group bacterium]
MKLTGKKRSILGKKVSTLRRKGLLPAILFGGEEKPIPLELKTIEFEQAYHQAGEATLIDLELGGEKQQILISEVQVNPLGKIIHTDLKRVLAGEKITANVPVIMEGEAPPVKNGEGILLTLLDEVEVESLPQNLPSEIKVDISGLTEVGQGIEIKDLPIDHGKVKVLDREPDELVLKIDYPQQEEEEEAAVAEEEVVAAVEATEEKPSEEAGEVAEESPKEVEDKDKPSS